MTAGNETPRHNVSRRELLKRVILGAATVVPASFVTGATSAQESFETLTSAEAATLEAIVARLIPTDENGPGATEARAAYYIDRALGDALAPSREAYTAGLAAVDALARRTKNATFARLAPQEQDDILQEMESGHAAGFTPNSSKFFELVRTHTLEGTFCDPHYGGNAGFIGWDLIGYPGIRIAVTADHQRLGQSPRSLHRSAYDFERFVKEVLRRGR